MLTAITKDNQTIMIFQHSPAELKKWSDRRMLFCPDCKETLIFKEGDVKQPHFAHLSRDCSFPFREPESIEHEKGKKQLFDWLVTQFTAENCKMEQHITQTNQRADTFLTKEQFALEFQCSPIQAKTWEKRISLYEEAGVSSFWVLGYSMHKYRYEHNHYIHKLNPLEKILLQTYKKIIYFDVLSNHFIFLDPLKQEQNVIYGQEFYFKPSDVSLNIETGLIESKYDFFLRMQKKRKQTHESLLEKANETNVYLTKTREQTTGAQVLASKRQLSYLEHLLKQKNMTLPYKLHGLLKHEARAIITDLLKQET